MLSSWTSGGASSSSGGSARPRRVSPTKGGNRSGGAGAAGEAAAEGGTSGSGGSGSGGSASSTSGTGGAAAGPSLIEMNREVAGGGRPMQSWERWYWGIGVGGVSLWLFWRLKPESKTPEQLEVSNAAWAPVPACTPARCACASAPPRTARRPPPGQQLRAARHSALAAHAPRPATPDTRLQEERRAAADLEVRRRDHLRSVLSAQRGGGFIAEGNDPLDGLSPGAIETFMATAGIDPRDPLEVGSESKSPAVGLWCGTDQGGALPAGRTPWPPAHWAPAPVLALH